MIIKIVVACDNDHNIGRNGDMPWEKVKKDLKHFKDLTSQKIILMGSKTFQSLGSKPLPNRTNIVLTSNPDFLLPIQNQYPNLVLFKSFDELSEFKLDELYIIGGASIYNHFWDKADELYITRIDAIFDNCDTKIQEVDLTKYELVDETEDFDVYNLRFQKYQKIK
jgi:dihydrofolate reductase